MSDSSIVILDSSGVARPVDAQLVGGDFQQTISVGDGANAGRKMAIDSAGRAQVRSNSGASSTTAINSVPAATASTALLASNTNRLGATFYNDSTAVLYIALTGTASTSAYTVQIAAGGYFSLPWQPIYVGAVSGIWAAANGAVLVTELT